jgi:hypothetical protein
VYYGNILKKTAKRINCKFYRKIYKITACTKYLVNAFPFLLLYNLSLLPRKMSPDASMCTPTKMLQIQGGAEPTDTFKMVIDNIWKQGKISEFVYRYVQVCHLLPTDYKLIFCKLHQADGLRLHQPLQGESYICCNAGKGLIP